MRRVVLILAVALAPFLAAQQPAKSDKPDISGMYSFLHEGEFVQINVEQTGLSGFVSREGATDTDKGEFLDHFFSKATLKGDDMSWTTKTVHGLWYEFKGRVQRGAGKKPGDEDYYELVGTLTEHAVGPNNADSARSREVTLKSFPAEVDQEQKQ